jgi:hypothetical protein
MKQRKCVKCGHMFSPPRCKKCLAAYAKEYAKKNRKKIREYNRKLRLSNIESARKYEREWQREKRKREPEKHKSSLRKSYQKHRMKRLAEKKAELLKVKLEVYNAYGGPKCNCCGESHIEFLSLDHIHDDGAKHRRELFGDSRAGSSIRMYKWLKKNNYPKDIIQILCMNCNMAKHIYGECPHKHDHN